MADQKKNAAAIVLAGGSGSRMHSKVAKQYLEVKGYPIIYYSLRAFEDHDDVSKIVLVCKAGEEEFCKKEIVNRYGFTKVICVVAGGAERYLSVINGLRALKEAGATELVLIHDGARPCITKEIIDRAIAGTKQTGACVSAMPVKDTIKIADANHFAQSTPDRSSLWQIQTPQTFSFELISNAYEKMIAEGFEKATDDAMAVETFTDRHVLLVEGDYMNIKVTTPEDLILADAFLTHIQDETK